MTDRHALAEALLSSDRPPLMVVWCGHRGDGAHRLASVHKLPTETVIVVKGFELLDHELGWAEPDGAVSFSTWAYPLEADVDRIVARCHHGTWLVHRHRVREFLAEPAATRGRMVAALSGPPASL